MHDPISFDPLRRPALVEDERLLYAETMAAACGQYGLIGAGGLPVAARRRPIWPDALGILAISRAEEEPFFLSKKRLLRELPRIELVEIDVCDYGGGWGEGGGDLLR